MMKKVSVLFLFLLVGVTLGGCAATNQSALVDDRIKMESMLAEAVTASEAGNSDKAIAILTEATGTFPVEKDPWLQIAQIHFASENYGRAITNALEALHRDPADQFATSIVAVSGLRLSTDALADLSRQNNLSGSLKTEAQELAKLLRETIGEPVLVPARSRAAASRARAVVARSSASRKALEAARPSVSSDPFGALK